MAAAKTITLFLMDGVANGKIKAQISGWSGIAYKIPRTLLAECKDLDPFKRSGVYFLFGMNSVYVGQAEVRKSGKGIHQRILEHETDKLKDSWDEVVMFTTKDNSFGKTEISYLENQFYNRAMKAERFSVKNGNEPMAGTVTEEKESELEDYIEKAELVLGALGYKVFEPKVEQTVAQPANLNAGVTIPPLPEGIEKVGDFILTAMRNLEAAGYVFSDEQMKILLDPVECKKKDLFNMQNSKVSFFKLYDPNEDSPHLVDGRQRYSTPKKVILKFGNYQVLLSKEWFDKYKHRELFTQWYNSL